MGSEKKKPKTADLWSTEELSTNFAELEGQDGRVVAVDPDTYRVVVARESHRKVKNLAYHEGSAASFPGTDSETYDMVFSSFVHPSPAPFPFLSSLIKKKFKNSCVIVTRMGFDAYRFKMDWIFIN